MRGGRTPAPSQSRQETGLTPNLLQTVAQTTLGGKLESAGCARNPAAGASNIGPELFGFSRDDSAGVCSSLAGRELIAHVSPQLCRRVRQQVRSLGLRFYTQHVRVSVGRFWNCWNSIAVMFELRCSKFELFCSESRDLVRPWGWKFQILRDSVGCGGFEPPILAS
jgi:hypothetical protein